jgi:CPA1 family monovalent cation:H+ antiporter
VESFLATETLVIELLLIVSLVAIAVRRLKVPYTVALVIVGLLLTTQQPVDINLTPELILALFVPPLVFEAAFHIRFSELRRSLPTILLFAIPGVIISTLIVAGIVSRGTALALPAALVFGALISATDPVAVVALFRSLGVPRRLQLLVEGESLFNDGTAIVLFNLLLASAISGLFSPWQGAAQFVIVSAGGVLVGVGLGWIIARVIYAVDDYLIETTLTTVLAFGSYLVAERLHLSGVLAVVAAGLVVGNVGPGGMSPTTRIVLFNFWEYVAFLANSLVFLLIGLEVNIPTLLDNWQPIVVAIGAVLVGRAVVIYGLGLLNNRITEPVPLKWLHVINWGGLRGAIALALALTLPDTLGGDRELIQVMAFGVVLFTLLVQSTTMSALIRRLGVVPPDPVRDAYELSQGRLAAHRAAALHLEKLHLDGLVSQPAWEAVRPELQERGQNLGADVRALQAQHPELAAAELDTVRREYLRAERGALLALRRDGVLHEETFEILTAEVDAALAGISPLGAPEAAPEAAPELPEEPAEAGKE